MLLAVRTSSYGCTWEAWRALKKIELLSAAPRATLKLLSCSPNFPRASITRCMHAKHEPIVKYCFNSHAYSEQHAHKTIANDLVKRQGKFTYGARTTQMGNGK